MVTPRRAGRDYATISRVSSLTGVRNPRFRSFLSGALIVVGLAGCAEVQTTNPGIVGVHRTQYMLVSEQAAERAAAQDYVRRKKQAAARHALNTNLSQLLRVRRIVRRLVAQTVVFRPDAPRWHWEVNIITSPEINANCAAGGKIMVYSGLIDKLKLTDAELAVVLGHEMAHALREHTREQMSRAYTEMLGMRLLAAATGLDRSQQRLMADVANLAINLPYSRRDEREADEIGLELAARAGYDPRAALSLWHKMAAATGAQPPEFLSDHPSDRARMQNIQRLLPRIMPLYEAARKQSRRHRVGR